MDSCLGHQKYTKMQKKTLNYYQNPKKIRVTIETPAGFESRSSVLSGKLSQPKLIMDLDPDHCQNFNLIRINITLKMSTIVQIMILISM